MHVLHVEDDPDIRDLVSLILSGEADVDSVESLAAARERLAGATYDVILTDLRLPDADGVDAVTILTPYGLPVVVLSAQTDGGVLVQAAASGAADYVGALNRDALLRRLTFACARASKQKASGSKPPFGRPRMTLSCFEALKPYITTSRAPFGA